MKRYLLIGLAAFGLSANAIGQNDGAIMLGNVEPTTNALVAGLENTLNTLVTTQSAVDVSPALGDTIVNSGSALVDGTEQFDTLGPGLTLMNADIQQSVNPLAVALDNPSLENLNAVFSYEDLSTVASNLGGIENRLIFGRVHSSSIGLKFAAIELLQGNLIDPDTTIVSGPSAIGSTLLGATYSGGGAFWDIDHGYQGPVHGTLDTTALVANRAAAGPLAPLETSLAPVFESAGPLTSPIGEELEDFYPGDIANITSPVFALPLRVAGLATGLIFGPQ